MQLPAKSLRLLFLAYLLLPITAAIGAPAATVAAVRPPAWITDRGAWMPVPAGMVLNAGDRIRTGPGGRVLLRLAEGTELRIGADTRFLLVRLDPPTGDDDFFIGLFKMARGALRFTTTPLSRAHRRNIDIQVASVNAGISGTDVWAKATPDRDIVCLLEGRITVGHGDDEPSILDRPLSFYVVPKGGPAEPIAPVTPEQVEKWTAQVSLEAGTGVISGGSWKVALASFRSREKAEQVVVSFREAGLPVELVTVNAEGTRWHRLVVSGFDDSSEAKAFARRARDLADSIDAWVYRS